WRPEGHPTTARRQTALHPPVPEGLSAARVAGQPLRPEPVPSQPVGPPAVAHPGACPEAPGLPPRTQPEAVLAARAAAGRAAGVNHRRHRAAAPTPEKPRKTAAALQRQEESPQ